MANSLDAIAESLQDGAFTQERRAEFANLADLLINHSNLPRRIAQLEQQPLLRERLDRVSLQAESVRAAAGFFRRLE